MNRKSTIYAEMNWQDFQDYVKQTPFALLPVGALEQHGPHLPFSTDVIIAEYMAKQIAERSGFILLPALAYTPSFSLRKFPGTIRVSDETFAEQLCEIARSLATHHIQFIYVVIAHIGAKQACQMAERKLLLEEHTAKLVNLALPGLDEAMQKYCTSKRWHPAFAHADEYETSVMLAIRADLVSMEKAVSEYPQKNPLMGPISVAWDEFCDSGVIGDATVATAEKGKAMLDLMIEKGLQIIAYHQATLKDEAGV